jgi:superfamily II DNA/RNA helicase
MPLIIHYEFPDKPRKFLYRVGSNGRLGSCGVGVSLITTQDAVAVRRVEKRFSHDIEELNSLDQIAYRISY